MINAHKALCAAQRKLTLEANVTKVRTQILGWRNDDRQYLLVLLQVARCDGRYNDTKYDADTHVSFLFSD